MTILEIKFINDLSFKYIHDLIMDYNPSIIRFIELEDVQNVEHIFEIAHILDLYNYKSEYVTYRSELPTEELSPDTFFRGIPFVKVYLNERV